MDKQNPKKVPMKRLMQLFLLSTMAASQSAHAQRPRRPPPRELTPEEKTYLEQRGNREIGVHDPSTIVKCRDAYWIFCTGMGTPSYYSKDLETWERGPSVFSEAPSWQAETVPRNRGMHYWAPDIVYHSGKYLLFFSISSFGVNTSAIGVTTNMTLDPDDPECKWSEPRLVITSDPSCNYNAIDPGVIVDQEGKLWMSFGSFWSGIQLVELDPETGTRIAPDAPVFPLAHYDSIEAPHLYYHDGYYYLFLNWGMCCRGANSTYNMRVGRSQSITGPYLDKAGEDMLAGGGTLLLETEGVFVGPGHPGVWKEGDTYLMSMHFYNAAQRGRSQYAIRPLTWDDRGWPAIEKPKPAPEDRIEEELE